MCARTVRIQRKPNSVAKFNQTLANDILPCSPQPKLQGRDDICCPRRYGSGGHRSMGVARAHRGLLPRHTYLAVLRALAHVMEGRPQACPALHVTFTQVLLASQPDMRVLVGGVGPLRLPSRLFGVLSPLPHWTF